MKSIVRKSIDQILEEYHQHLLGTVGAAQSTCKRWKFHVRLFLRTHFKEAAWLDWSTVTASVLLQYFLERSQYDLPPRLQAMASALRSFVRFLCLSARCSGDPGVGIPRIASGRREELPGYLSQAQLTQLLDSFADSSPAGLRDCAIVICLARLGLRAGEVGQLTLDHVNWREGILTLTQTKGRKERQLPLSAEVGTALVKYLRLGRPATSSRHLFLSTRRIKPLSTEAVSRVVAQGLKRAGILTPRKGAHLLRHTLASHLVQQGAGLKEVADLLGHSSLNSTRVYAKVNQPMLRELAQPWPLEATR